MGKVKKNYPLGKISSIMPELPLSTQRLRQAVDIAFNGNKRAFAEALGWKAPSIYKYLDGTRPANGRAFLHELEQIGIRSGWVENGRGDMFADNVAGQALRNSVLAGKEKLKPRPQQMVEYAELTLPHDAVAQGISSPPEVPLMLSPVAAGTPMLADDYVDRRIDFNELLVRDVESTIVIRVRGDSMYDAGIEDGSLVIVDRGLQAQTGDVVICSVDGELTCKEWHWVPGGYAMLYPRNSRHRPIRAHTNRVKVYGVVAWVIKEVPRGNVKQRRK